MRLLPSSFVLLAACGRFGFGPSGDGDARGGDGDGANAGDDAAAGPCTPVERVIPGTPLIYRIARVPDGWAVVHSVDGNGTQVYLDVIDDDNNVTLNGPMIFNAANSGDIVFVGDRLAIAYTDAGIGHIVFHALDGSQVAPPVTFGATGPSLYAHDGVVEAVTFTFGTLVARTFAPDGSIVRDARTLVASGASLLGPITHDAGGITALWFGAAPNPPLHLTAIADDGSVRVADRQYGVSTGASTMTTTGTGAIAEWTTSGQVPKIVVLDQNLAEVSPPSTYLGLASGAGADIVTEGTEIGFVRFGPTVGQVTFATSDLAGQRTSADVTYGQAANGASAPYIAAGPKRFAFVWGPGNPPTELRFAVVCR